MDWMGQAQQGERSHNHQRRHRRHRHGRIIIIIRGCFAVVATLYPNVSAAGANGEATVSAADRLPHHTWSGGAKLAGGEVAWVWMVGRSKKRDYTNTEPQASGRSFRLLATRVYIWENFDGTLDGGYNTDDGVR